MEFEEARKTFEQKFREIEPCISIEDGLLVGMLSKGVEVHWRIDQFGGFEVMSKKDGIQAGPNFLKSIKLSIATEDDIKDMAKDAASCCRKLIDRDA